MYFITFIASPKKNEESLNISLKYSACPSYHFIYWRATDQSVRVHDLPHVKLRMLAQISLHCQSVPGGTIVRVVAVVQEQLLSLQDECSASHPHNN